MVSPTSIRSRILKAGVATHAWMALHRSFTHVDPFEDTERRLLASIRATISGGFTHVDPFEDTERLTQYLLCLALPCFTHVDPFEDTER